PSRTKAPDDDAPRSKRVRGRAIAASPRLRTATKSQTAVPKGDSSKETSNLKALLKSLDGLPRANPAFREPMKALLVERLPEGDKWLYEVKFDGIRAIAIKNGQK